MTVFGSTQQSRQLGRFTFTKDMNLFLRNELRHLDATDKKQVEQHLLKLQKQLQKYMDQIKEE